MKKFLEILPICSLLISNSVFSDGFEPNRIGPYHEQSWILDVNPIGYMRSPGFGAWDFKAGWVEPLNFPTHPFFQGSYLETQGNASLSPFQSDIGTAFNLKPIRFLKMGVGYNRLLYHNSLVGFSGEYKPELTQWQTDALLDPEHQEVAGSDIFSFRGSIFFELASLQIYAGGFRSLWDIDSRSRNIFYEYRSGLLIKKRDRINSLDLQSMLNLEPYFRIGKMMARGIRVQEQMWWTSQTHLYQNLVSVGLMGIRWGQNTSRIYQGADFSIGYWVAHPQFENQNRIESFHINLEWKCNTQWLNVDNP